MLKLFKKCKILTASAAKPKPRTMTVSSADWSITIACTKPFKLHIPLGNPTELSVSLTNTPFKPHRDSIDYGPK